MIMEYKGYSGTVHQGKDGHYHGRITGIDDDVRFSGSTIDSFESAFRATVDDYIQRKRSRRNVLLSVLGFLLGFMVLLVVTCPSESAHKERIGTVVKQGIGMSTGADDDGLGAFLQLIGGGIAGYAVDQMLEVNSYFLFSVGTVTYEDRTRPLTVGVLGHVFTTVSKEDVSEMLNSL